MSVISIKNLRKEFKSSQKGKPNVVAIDDASFDIEEGQIFGLLGPNGAGKTTTVSALACTLTPTGGSVSILGYDLHRDCKKIKKQIGLVPQQLALYMSLTGQANLEFFGGIYGLHGKELQKQINLALEIVGLKGREKDKVKTYSGGMKRRLNLAAGLLHHPKVLFLDEPTVGVDPQSRNHIFESVKKLNKEENMTIVYTSHYMEEVEALCEKVAIMDQGKIVASDTVSNLIEIVEGHINLGLNKNIEEVMFRLKDLPIVDNVRQTDHKVIINTTHFAKALPEILNVVDKIDTEITSIKILEPNLESVFLKLTGKQLRDY